eukprot:COSAG05_NODE_3371_length_2106_cov_4.593197_1_plen_149_part_00
MSTDAAVTKSETMICVRRVRVYRSWEHCVTATRDGSEKVCDVGERLVVFKDPQVVDASTVKVVRTVDGWVRQTTGNGKNVLVSLGDFGADTDGDGFVSIDEFVMWFLRLVGRAPTPAHYALFYAADSAGHGSLPSAKFEDLKASLCKL